MQKKLFKKLNKWLSIPLIIFLINYNSFGQFTITNQISYQAGDSITSFECDTLSVSGGTPGINVIWDFSNLIIDTSKYTVFYQTGNTNVCNNIANRLFTSTSWYSSPWTITNTRSYFSDSSLYSYLGMNQTGGPTFSGSVCYSDPLNIMEYPLNYTQQFTDTGLAIASGGGFGGSFRKYYTFLTKEYDGYGTLIFPNGIIINNVARLKVNSYSTDSSFSNNAFTGMWSESVANGYEWYDSGFHGSIFSITESNQNYFDSTLIINSVYSKSVTIRELLSTGVLNKETQRNLVVYPNPSNGKICFNYNENMTNNSHLKLINSFGKEFYYGNFPKTNCLDLGLPEGIYFLTVESKLSKTTHKLIVTH
jgi:hypothetical protein